MVVFSFSLSLSLSCAVQIEHQAHGAKTNDPCINRHDDERLILRDGATLPAQGVGHETEISFFKMADYEAYKQDPVLKWN